MVEICINIIFCTDDPNCDFRKFIKDNRIEYVGFDSAPMCGSVRITGVKNPPDDLPEWAKYQFR